MTGDPYSSRPWLKYYDANVPHQIQYPDVSFWEYTKEAFERFPDRVAVYYMGRPLTFKQVDIMSSKFAGFLKSNGLQQGDVVGVNLPNLPAYYISLIGTLKAGCVLSGVSPLLSQQELENQLKDSGAKALVTFDLLFTRVKQAVPGTKIKAIAVTGIADYLPTVMGMLGKLLNKIPSGEVTPIEGITVKRFTDIIKEMPPVKIGEKIDPDSVCVMQYTGGTTGVPKGALLTHRNIVAEMVQVTRWLDVQMGKEVGLTAAPFFHIAGLVIGMSLFANGMIQVAVPNPRDQKFLISAIKKFKPDFIGNVPVVFLELMKRPDFRALDFSTVKYFVSGAAPFPAEYIREFEGIVGEGKLIEVYGMTETSCVVMALPRYGRKKAGSVGIPLPDIEVRIVDPVSAEIAPVGEPGELLLKGPQVFSRGYHNKPDETAHAMRDGWFHTGDIVRMDEDGYFYVVDRLKDMVNVSGYKVYTRELDEIIGAHPDVDNAASVGIPDPQRPGSEIVATAVVLKPNVAKSEETKRQLTDYIKEKVSPYKVPKTIEFMDQLPTSALGKVLKKELKKAMIKEA